MIYSVSAMGLAAIRLFSKIISSTLSQEVTSVFDQEGVKIILNCRIPYPRVRGTVSQNTVHIPGCGDILENRTRKYTCSEGEIQPYSLQMKHFHRSRRKFFAFSTEMTCSSHSLFHCCISMAKNETLCENFRFAFSN